MTTPETILTNARLILPGEVVAGTVTLRDGRIADIASGLSAVPGAQDCGGAFLAPGLVELHTDNLERHMQPRPGVDWPHRAAILAHDRELAGTGITTVFDALRVGSILSSEAKKSYGKYARQVASEILELRAAKALRISHHIHLRAEVCSETLLEEMAEFGPEDRIGLVSIMDHTPGQRQFRDLSKFEEYMCGKNGLSREAFADHVEFLGMLHARFGARHEAGAVAAARRYGARIASHDDTTADQVAASDTLGASLAEFPTTLEAARACRDRDIAIIMGAPNIIRGGSHSGNIAAADLVEAGLLDILSSDYIPAALLMAAVQVGQMLGDMAKGLHTVTAAPAAATGLDDRGRLEVGLRGDVIRFSLLDDRPVLHGVWAEGLQIG